MQKFIPQFFILKKEKKNHCSKFNETYTCSSSKGITKTETNLDGPLR